MKRLRFLTLSLLLSSLCLTGDSQAGSSSCNVPGTCNLVNCSSPCVRGSTNNNKNCCGVSKRCSGAKSFFRPRAVVEDVDFFLGLNNYYFYRNYFSPTECDDSRVHFARGFFYERSTNRRGDRNNKHNLASYFLPGNKGCMNVSESGCVTDNTPDDFGSLWAGVVAPDAQVYKSLITLCPRRSIWGGYFEYRQDFDCVMGTWLDVKFAVYEARHNIHASEALTDPNVMGELPGAHTVLEALSNDGGLGTFASSTLAGLKYGKISRCKTKKTGFDDIEVKFGYNWLACPESGHYAGVYGDLLIPIASKPTAEFLFEPLVGRAHWGLGVGFDGGWLAWQCEDQSLALMVDFCYTYLFKSRELRSFDLCKNGQWSRYLRVAQKNTPAVSFPAINFTTLPVEVTPRSVVNLWFAAHHQWCNWHAEIGYNFWWRQAEKVCLRAKGKCNSANGACGTPQAFNNLNIGIFGMGNVCTPTSNSTACVSQGKVLPSDTSCNNVVPTPDATFVPLTIADLDLRSAAQPRVITNKVYAAVSYDTCIWARPISVGIGGSYEFARDINALEEWAVWGNFETSF